MKKERELFQGDYDDIKTSTLCNVKLIQSYGLQGIQDSVKRENNYCPGIRDNCCSKSDEKLSMNYWLQRVQTPLENRYKVYYETISYLLGFLTQVDYLAKDMRSQENGKCKNISLQYLSMNFNYYLAQSILKEIRHSLDKIINYRKGFFCVLCDAQTSSKLDRFWNTEDERYKKRIYYSQNFCRQLTDNNLKAAFYVHKYVRAYLELASNLIMCRLNIKEHTEFEILKEEQLKVKNCLYFKDKYFFFFCEKFCEEFQISTVSPIFDGYNDQLQPFFRVFSQHRKNAFFYPNRNEFVDDPAKSETFIEKFYQRTKRINVFIQSQQKDLSLSNIKTDFVIEDGLTLDHSVVNSLYQLSYKSAKIIAIFAIFLSLFQFKIQRLQFIMKLLFIFAYVIKRLFQKDFTDYQCVSEVLQFYGFEGLENPISYEQLIPNMNNNYCPHIKDSCCSRLDFQKTQRLWDIKALNIKMYLTKIFKSVQKITVLQSSLLQLAKQVRDKESDQCKEVDFTFFNSPIKYNQVYFYLQNALQSFAFMQRGFYCLLCDASQHPYLAIPSSQTRRYSIISHKFCNDLIFFFREFLMFKVYYLDPLMVNTNLLFNCLSDSETYTYNFFYNASYASLNDCLENGQQCEYLCKEFKFGVSDQLFIGQLNEYMDFIKKIEDIITKYGDNIKVETFKPLDELFLDDKEYPNEFFLDWEQGIQDDKQISLKFFNMTQMEIDVKEEGLNMFDIAYKSNYFLTNSMSQNIVHKHYEVYNPGQQKDIKGTSKLDQQNYAERNIPEFLNQHRIKKIQQEELEQKQNFMHKQMENPNRPSKQDMIQYVQMAKNMDEQIDKEFRNQIKESQFAEGNIIDFGKAGQIPEYMSFIINKILFLFIFFLIYQLIF